MSRIAVTATREAVAIELVAVGNANAGLREEMLVSRAIAEAGQLAESPGPPTVIIT